MKFSIFERHLRLCIVVHFTQFIHVTVNKNKLLVDIIIFVNKIIKLHAVTVRDKVIIKKLF